MLKYSLKRLASSLITLLIIITVVFVLLRQMPIEGYFDNFEKADQATIQAKLNQLGLNDPIPVQLWNFVKNIFHGDLTVFDLGLEMSGYLQSKQVNNAGVGFFVLGVECLLDGYTDLGNIKLSLRTVSFYYTVHTS